MPAALIRARSRVVGWCNGCIPDSIAPDACWCDGKSTPRPMKPFYTWLVLCSASVNVIVPEQLNCNWLLRFPNKLLVSFAPNSYCLDAVLFLSIGAHAPH